MRTQTEQNERTLEEVAPGERGVILQVGNENGPVKRRLVDMGLTPCTEVTVRKAAAHRHGAAHSGRGNPPPDGCRPRP